MLGYSDWIVGVVSILLGLALCFGAATSAQLLFELPKVRWLDQRIGRVGTRAFIATLGLVLLLLGVAIALGWKIHWQERRTTACSALTGTCSA